MCLEDKRLAREMASQAFAKQVPLGASARIVEADESRNSITFSSDGTSTVWVQPENIASATLTGFTLTPTNPIREFTIETHGNIVTRPWTAFGGAANANLSVIVTSLGKR